MEMLRAVTKGASAESRQALPHGVVQAVGVGVWVFNRWWETLIGSP